MQLTRNPDYGHMTRIDKLKTSFALCTGTFPYKDFVAVLRGLGYEPMKKGATAGSRRKFRHSAMDHMIWLDEPHDGEMTAGMVRRLRDDLIARGLL